MCGETKFLRSSGLPRSGTSSTEWKCPEGTVWEGVWNQLVRRRGQACLAGGQWPRPGTELSPGLRRRCSAGSGPVPSFRMVVLRQLCLLWTAIPILSILLFSLPNGLSSSHLICLGDLW